ncbi:MAG: FeoB-associated Cys-rich membrane protein [Oscillospiraceae bacterium]|nr:FeoB-associated Cys-rich membrane protein [Oscillospiraceae bacterium]
MFVWLAENAVTVIVLAAVLLMVGAAAAILAKDRKRGNGACTGNCAACRMGCASEKKI